MQKLLWDDNVVVILIHSKHLEVMGIALITSDPLLIRILFESLGLCVTRESTYKLQKCFVVSFRQFAVFQTEHCGLVMLPLI